MTGPHSTAPLIRQGRDLHCSLMPTTCIGLGLVDGFTLLQVTLDYLHHQGIQQGLWSDSRVSFFLLFRLSQGVLLWCQLCLLLFLLVLVQRLRLLEKVTLGKSDDGLLCGGLLSILLIQDQVSSILLTLHTVKPHNCLIPVAKLIGSVRDIALSHGPLAELLAKMVQLSLRIDGGRGSCRGRCHGVEPNHRNPRSWRLELWA
mmetsp:Transcript_20127/g.33613  ORF Transcript_20127/g.33613 Transcript_20127/m.33613 type:complete len:202 (-) Transcript_20127:2-607(-)